MQIREQPRAVMMMALTIAACLIAQATRGAAFDFSPGSDQRIGEHIENAHIERYQEAVAAYAAECEARPDDAQLALERVKFIERFLYSEDLYIESAEADHAAAKDYLESRFSDVPGTILHRLESLWNEEFFSEARKHERAAWLWRPADHAAFELLLARRYSLKQDALATRQHAKRAFDVHPTADAGIVLAQALHEAELARECLEVLRHPAFGDAPAWTRKQKMDLLFALKETVEAMEIFRALEDSEEVFLGTTDTVTMLLAQGQIEAARDTLAKIELNDWNRASVLRQRFDLDLEHGSGAQALAAYRALRDAGFSVDPLLQVRFSLFRRHPLLPWDLRDLAGLLALAGVLVASVASPLALLVPVHYWGLRRWRAGKPPGIPIAPWNLRSAWLALGVLVVAEVASLWFSGADVIDNLLGEDDAATGTLTPLQFLHNSLAVWLVMTATLGGLVWWHRAGSMLGPGRWRIGKCIGMAVVSMIGLRMLAGVHAALMPDLREALAPASSAVLQLMSTLLENYGALALIGVVGLLVPLIEETIFRGVLLGALARHVPFWAANGLQAVLFAIVHEEYRLFVFYVAFGVICGVLTRRAGGLLPALIVHAANNSLAALVIAVLHHRSH